jgi:hypothetical protein
MKQLGMLVHFDRAMNALRSKRNSLLSATDYLALSDNTMTEEAENLQTSIKRYY